MTNFEYLEVEITINDAGGITQVSCLPLTPTPQTSQAIVWPVDLLNAFGGQGWEVISEKSFGGIGDSPGSRDFLLKRTV